MTTLPAPPTPTEQLARIATQLGVDLAALRDGGREFAEQRGLAAWALRRTFAGLRLAQIGALMGFDHSTISYHLKRVNVRISTDPAFAAQARALVPGRYLVQWQKVVGVVVEACEEAQP